MELSTIENDEVEVEFIKDEEVIHIIKEEISPQKNRSKALTKTSKKLKDTSHNYQTSITNKKTKKKSYCTDEDSSESESDFILKPKVLFNDGDIPGEYMFNFNLKERKISKNESITLSSQTTPKSKTKITKNDLAKCSKSDQDNYKDEQDTKIDNEKEIKFNISHKRLIRATLEDKDESKSLNDDKFNYETPKKSKNMHTSNNTKTQSSTDLIPNSVSKTMSVGEEELLTKTPKVVRKKIAKGIAHQKIEQLNEANDSDYSISDKNDESDSDNSTPSNVQKPQSEVSSNTNITLRRSTRKKEISFMYRSEEYFLSKSIKSLKKSKTSDNTLKLLKNPILDKKQVDRLSKNSNAVHDNKFKALHKDYVSKFPYWLRLLKEGFNLLLYGFGSKRQIINDFRESMLKNEPSLIINGFFPGLTLKEILESINIDILDLESCPGSAELAIQQIEETVKVKNVDFIYILINNIDGIELQNCKTQHVLSRICSLKNVCLVASIDKVNAALMWDNTKLGDYNFIWMDCTNYLPYTVETSYIESLMVKNTGSIHAFSALNNVYKSLNSNSKRILLLLIKDRIENKNDKKYGGVPFSILYGWCRQQFLVSTDLALRSQLTEFVDHQLVKWKRDADVLYIPVDIDVLLQFYKQNEEDYE